MTKIELVKSSDLSIAHKIWQKYYKDKFQFPSLIHFLRFYKITNLDDEAILFGGIKIIPEVICLTNHDSPIRDRHEALYKFLKAMELVAQENNFDQIHIFPEDDKIWRKRLEKEGFARTKYPAYFRNT